MSSQTANYQPSLVLPPSIPVCELLFGSFNHRHNELPDLRSRKGRKPSALSWSRRRLDCHFPVNLTYFHATKLWSRIVLLVAFCQCTCHDRSVTSVINLLIKIHWTQTSCKWIKVYVYICHLFRCYRYQHYHNIFCMLKKLSECDVVVALEMKLFNVRSRWNNVTIINQREYNGVDTYK